MQQKCNGTVQLPCEHDSTNISPDGLQAAVSSHKQRINAHCCLLALTAKSDADVAQRCINALYMLNKNVPNGTEITDKCH
jgi:hypothetical protein